MTPLLLLQLALAAPPPLTDQLGREDSLARHRGETVLALVVTAKRLRSLKGWELALRERLDGVSYLRVVDVPAQPKLSHERVAEKLRKRVPEEVAIGIDLERRWAEAFGLDTDEVNVLLFDAGGGLAARFRGRRSQQLVEQVAAAALRLPGVSRGAKP